MIRVVTIDEYDSKQLQKFCGLLYTAFGVGCEHVGTVELGGNEPYDAAKIIDSLEQVRAYADDKILYVTSRKLKDRDLPTGTAPTHGYCHYNKVRALISTTGVKDLEAGLKVVGRNALHQLGHLWELHHCLDPRCSMYLPWTPSFVTGDAIFCTFCRDKSEQRIRLAKS